MVELRIARAAQPDAVAAPDVRTAGAIADVVGGAASGIAGAVQRQMDANEQIAQSEHRIAMRAQEDEDNRLIAERGAALAQITEQLTVDYAGFVNEAGPGAQGLSERVRTHVANVISEFEAGFGSNERVRQRFSDNIASLAGRVVARAELQTIESRARARADNNDQALAAAANALYRHDDPATLTAAFGEQLALIDTLAASQTDVPDEQRAEWRRGAIERVTRSMMDGLIARGGHDAVGGLLESGQFDAILSPEAMRNMRGQVAASQRAAQIAAEAQVNEARRAVQDEIDTVEGLIDANEVVPDERLVAISRNAQAVGLAGDDRVDLALLRERNARRRVFQRQPVSALRSALAAVQGRMANGRATPEDMRAAEDLGRMIEARDNDTAAPLRTEYESGPQGQLAVAGQLRSLPREDRFRMAERVAPGFGFVVNLTSERQRLAINGRRVREANPDRVSDADTRRVFRARVGDAGHFYDAAALDHIRELAADLYAASYSGAPPERFDQERYAVMVDRAFGGGDNRQEGGGIGRWNGRPFILPPGYSATGFGNTWARAPWANARQSDGSRPSMETVRTRFRPVFHGESDAGYTYEWHDAQGRALQHADGGAFRLIIPRRAGAR